MSDRKSIQYILSLDFFKTRCRIKRVFFLFHLAHIWSGKCDAIWHNPGNVQPPSKPEDSIICNTNKSYGMKVNITI